MNTEQVTRRLEMFVSFGFKWIAAGTGGFHHWVTAGNPGSRPEFMTCGLCCFHLPLAAAIETGSLSRDRAGDLVVDQMQSGISGGVPKQWVPKGLTKHQTLLNDKHPARGDLVFFSGAGAPYFAHVAVATGDDDEVISFGHDAPYLQGGTHTRLVEKLSIAQVKRVNSALTGVHFGSPSW